MYELLRWLDVPVRVIIGLVLTVFYAGSILWLLTHRLNLYATATTWWKDVGIEAFAEDKLYQGGEAVADVAGEVEELPDGRLRFARLGNAASFNRETPFEYRGQRLVAEVRGERRTVNLPRSKGDPAMEIVNEVSGLIARPE